MARHSKASNCHPDKRHWAKGKCRSCYNRSAYLYIGNNKKYGLTGSVYEEKSAAQDGKCAICNKPPQRNRLAIDHDHSTEQVRDLLCVRCNLAVGVLESGKFVRCLDYLAKHGKSLTILIDTSRQVSQQEGYKHGSNCS